MNDVNTKVAKVVASANGQELLRLVSYGKEIDKLPEEAMLSLHELVAVTAYHMFKLVIEGEVEIHGDTKH
jgi:hypothetical protein